MKKFEGKKLLVLGSNVGSSDIVKYAHRNGAYVYVADYYEPARSDAKRYCDEPVLMSTGDTAGLVELVQREKIDGVFAGVSEFNLLQAQTIALQTGLRFYCSREQWNAVENKAQFRTLCEQYGVPRPQTYFIGAVEIANIKNTPPICHVS